MISWVTLFFYLVVFIVTTVIFVYIRKEKNTGEDIEYYFSAAILSLNIWSFLHVIVLTLPFTGFGLIMWNLTFLLLLTASICWFIFAVYYSGYGYYITENILRFFTIFVIISFFIVMLNPLHNLIWNDVVIEQDIILNSITQINNTGFLIYILIGYMTNFSSALLLFLTMVKSTRLKTTQTFVFIIGVFFGTVIHLTDALFIQQGFDSIAITVLIIVFIYIFFAEDVFTVTPIMVKDVMESMSNGIVTLSVTGKVIDYNEKTAELFPDINENEQIEHVAPEIIKNQNESFDETEIVDMISRQDGEKYYNVNLSPIKQNGIVKGYIITFRDVTTIRKNTKDLEKQTERLEQFLEFVSHDIRTPLTVAQIYSEDLYKETDNTHAEKTLEALKRVEELIDSSVDLARQGEVIREQVEVDINEVITGAVRSIQTENVVIDNKIPDSENFYCDPERFKTLFENLIRNSIEHGGEDVVITIGLMEENGLYFEDNGPGIPEEKHDQVFEEGFTTGDSTGFGLTIVREIVNAHNGDIMITEPEHSDTGVRFEIVNI